MTKVLVLGGSGMLGSMVVDVLSRAPRLRVIATARDETLCAAAATRLRDVEWVRFDVGDGLVDPTALGPLVAGIDWVINAIGITKPYIGDSDGDQIERAIRVNALFPQLLARAASSAGARVVQIATDCVYSGREGRYREGAAHDPSDVYGKSKSLGEAYFSSIGHLRCSIVGPEPKSYAFLLEWIRRQPRAARLRGFVNHRWNGVTTLAFARLCQGVIEAQMTLDHLQHVIPGDEVSKHELLGLFCAAFDRGDIEVAPVEAPKVIDRTLATDAQARNGEIWRAAGYDEPPTIRQMVEELGAFDFRMADLTGKQQES